MTTSMRYICFTARLATVAIKAFLLSLNPAASVVKQWDYGFLKDFLEGDMWRPPGWEGFDISACDRLVKAGRALVAIPARHHKEMEREINAELNKIGRVVLFLLGDEEADFDADLIDHPNIAVWVQNPHPGKHDAFHRLGTGYPPHMRDCLPISGLPQKNNDLFFSGQLTHKRRHEMWDVLVYYQQENPGRRLLLNRTRGFTQGMNPNEYYQAMTGAKIAPCPSGAVIPDSFRLFEALQCMAVPIADETNPAGDISLYWDWLFGCPVPFPKLTEWDRLYGLIDETLDGYPSINHRITAWWINYKRDFAYKVMGQLNA